MKCLNMYSAQWHPVHSRGSFLAWRNLRKFRIHQHSVDVHGRIGPQPPVRYSSQPHGDQVAKHILLVFLLHCVNVYRFSQCIRDWFQTASCFGLVLFPLQGPPFIRTIVFRHRFFQRDVTIFIRCLLVSAITLSVVFVWLCTADL